ncbi:MAG: hypothetical protein ACI9J2_001299 [Saprospiraceae bacterium]|jgi:uncharacterized protein YehS (DUF1456 family)
MTNNEILRRVRYLYNYSDDQMLAIFAAADGVVAPRQLANWMKKEEDRGYQECRDKEMAIFLNGFINVKRGKKEGDQPTPETRLSNNIIFRKLKIALNLQAEDIMEMMTLAGLPISKHELSAFFRRPDHKHFRLCKDQILRNFLNGLQMKRKGLTESVVKAKPKEPSKTLRVEKTESDGEKSAFSWNKD